MAYVTLLFGDRPDDEAADSDSTAPKINSTAPSSVNNTAAVGTNKTAKLKSADAELYNATNAMLEKAIAFMNTSKDIEIAHANVE